MVLRKISGNGVCSQNVIYKSKIGEQAIFPLTKDNNFVKFSVDRGEISFEVDAANAQTESIQIQQFGGEMVPVTVKP